MSHGGTVERLPKEFKELLPLFQGWLDDALPTLSTEPTLAAAVVYSLTGPGKRIRPLLTLALGELCGVEIAKLRPFCLALEFVHTSSLIHDDLPALDNDDFRRGMPTLHRKFDEATALLAGDLLLARAALEVTRAEGVCSETRARWGELISEATITLCEGQVMDLRSGSLAEGSERVAVEQLRELCIRKTGALFRAAALGVAALAPELSQRARFERSLTEYAVNLGLLFQITDDLLDHRADILNSAPVGEGSRSKEQTLSTYVSILGVDGAERSADETAAAALAALSEWPEEQAMVVAKLVELVRKRDK